MRKKYLPDMPTLDPSKQVRVLTSHESMMFLIEQIWDNNILPLDTSEANTLHY